MDEKKKPAIRFRGFMEEWEERKLGEDVADIVGGGTPNTLNPAYWNGNIDWYTPTEIGKKVYAEDSEKKITELGLQKSSARILPAHKTVLFTSRAGIGDMAILQHLGTTNQGFQSLIIKDGYNTYFIYSIGHLIKKYALKNASGSTFLEISGKKLGKMELMCPSFNEQTKIGTFYQNLDYLITLHQRKYEKLQNFKKSMLEKMFPQNGSSAPEIRFKGFMEDWEQRKFGEIVDSYIDPVPTPHNGYIRLGIRSHAKGTFHNYVEKGKELETAQMHKVASGNFIVNITFGWEHAVAITDENDAGKLVSHRFPQFQFHEQLVPEFFKYVILDDKFRHHLWVASPGGAGRNRVLKINEMLEYKMIFPCEEEQQKIATYFKHLDHLITLHQRKLEKLQNIKKACLEKMFV